MSSFGNGLYITNVDIEMGAHDSWGVLFSRNSNGALTDVSIKGAAEPSGGHDGVAIQNGASAYIGGSGADSVIEGVDRGIMIRNEGFATVYGTLKIKANIGIQTFSSGTFRLSLSGDGKITAPIAIGLNLGGLAYIDNSDAGVSIDGDINLISSTLGIGGNTVLSDSTSISVDNGNLNIWSEVSGIEADRLVCQGVSVVNITTLSLANNGGNKCLDNSSWMTLIESVFPSSSSSSMQKSEMARKNSNTSSTDFSKSLTTPSTERIGGELPW